jgi:hypothetical protein
MMATMTMEVIMNDHTQIAVLDALHSGKPNPAIAAQSNLYGRFVGAWHVDVALHEAGGVRRVEGEWHFGWVLDGYAIQDVWIVPARRLRGEKKPGERWFWGTTLRWYDPAIDAWHIRYIDPSVPIEVRQVSRAVGADIVQVGEAAHGLLTRWRFLDIAQDSFRWLGERSWDKGATWSPATEMRARRI